MGAVVGVRRRRGLEITCCLFRIDRNLEGVKCASETQTLAHDTPVTVTGVSRSRLPGLAGDSWRHRDKCLGVVCGPERCILTDGEEYPLTSLGLALSA